MAAEDKIELDDILAIIKRRKFYFIVPVVLGMLAAAYIATVLPPVYESKATILIVRQQIPDAVVETTVTGYVEERIEGISQRVMTDEKLWAIAEQYDLYAGERDPEHPGETAGRMRSNILRQSADVGVSTQRGSRVSTVSVSIAFQGEDPEKTQAVAEAISNLFVEESQRERIEKAEAVSDFLSREAGKFKVEIDAYEQNLADFKQKHASTLPEVASVNTRLLEKAQAELEDSEDQIRQLEQRRIQLKAELAGTTPTQRIGGGRDVLLSPDERLSVLRSEYVSKSGTYASDHPDLVRLRREISSLEGQGGGGSGGLMTEIDDTRRQLGELRQRYSDEHPDVKKMRRQLQSLEGRLSTQFKGSIATSSIDPATANPRYVSLKAELEALDVQTAQENQKLPKLRDKIAELEARMMEAPIVEKDYLALSRDYENAVRKYQELKSKQSEANLAEQLETSSKGERFTLSQPASLPTVPIKPNRPAILIIGFVLALGSGIGMSSVAEYYDKRIYGSKGVRSVMGAPPLAQIRAISSSGMIKAVPAGGAAGMGGALALVLVASLILLAGMHFFWKPLDEAWAEFSGQAPALESAVGAAAESTSPQ